MTLAMTEKKSSVIGSYQSFYFSSLTTSTLRPCSSTFTEWNLNLPKKEASLAFKAVEMEAALWPGLARATRKPPPPAPARD